MNSQEIQKSKLCIQRMKPYFSNFPLPNKFLDFLNAFRKDYMDMLLEVILYLFKKPITYITAYTKKCGFYLKSLQNSTISQQVAKHFVWEHAL